MTTIERYLLTRSKEFNLGPNEEVRVDLKLKVKPLPPKTNVTGKVSSNGHPLSHVTVKILDSHFDPLDHVLTNDDGVYLFENLPPGNYKVTATAPGYLIANVVSFTLKPRETVIINFELKEDKNVRTKNYVYGRVTEVLTNEVIENAEVKLFSTFSLHPVAESFSNDDGQYLLCAIAAGEYILIASKRGFAASEPIRFQADQGQLIKIDFQLYLSASGGGTVSGVITDALCPEPGDVYVGLFKVGLDDETLIQVKTTVNSGFYLFTDIPPGEYMVKAKQNEQWQCVQRGITL